MLEWMARWANIMKEGGYFVVAKADSSLLGVVDLLFKTHVLHSLEHGALYSVNLSPPPSNEHDFEEILFYFMDLGAWNRNLINHRDEGFISATDMNPLFTNLVTLGYCEHSEENETASPLIFWTDKAFNKNYHEVNPLPLGVIGNFYPNQMRSKSDMEKHLYNNPEILVGFQNENNAKAQRKRFNIADAFWMFFKSPAKKHEELVAQYMNKWKHQPKIWHNF